MTRKTKMITGVGIGAALAVAGVDAEQAVEHREGEAQHAVRVSSQRQLLQPRLGVP